MHDNEVMYLIKWEFCPVLIIHTHCSCEDGCIFLHLTALTHRLTSQLEADAPLHGMPNYMNKVFTSPLMIFLGSCT